MLGTWAKGSIIRLLPKWIKGDSPDTVDLDVPSSETKRGGLVYGRYSMIWTFRALQPHYFICKAARQAKVCIISSGRHRFVCVHMCRIGPAFVDSMRFLDPMDTANHLPWNRSTYCSQLSYNTLMQRLLGVRSTRISTPRCESTPELPAHRPFITLGPSRRF